MRSLFQTLEELVIDLTKSEKSTFYRFLGLYLVSSFILLSLIAFFYYQNEKRLYFDLTKSNMQNIISKISSKIIMAHMNNTHFDTSEILDTDKYKISFYDKKKKKIFGNLENIMNFSKNIIKNKQNFILIDSSTLGHLDIYYIALQENILFNKIQELKYNLIMISILIYLIISLIGFYLAKLFLKPIKEERVKLNNFIKDTTHELNTPISALLMSTESQNLSVKQIERIRLSAKRVSRIYQDLTYIFLQDKNRQKNVKTLELKEIIKEQLLYFEPLASRKQVTISYQLNEFQYRIYKDDFIRVINNLISNAIKYNKQNGKIEIILEKNSLIIKDNGIGIQKDKINDIFKRYYRATNEHGGFGIGLHIVKDICDRYEINIDVISSTKSGTTFILNFLN